MFDQSVRVTQVVFKLIRRRVPANTRCLAFCVDDTKPYYDEFRRICLEEDIEFIDGIPQAVRRIEESGIIVRAKDGSHWNEKGNEVVAGVLKEVLRADY